VTGLFADRDVAGAVAERIKVFAQPQRLMILSCLLLGERNVGEIADITGLVQPALSQQLGELRRAELVQTRKEAKTVWYSLADEAVASCVRHIEALFGQGNDIPPVPRPPAPKPQQTNHGVAAFARIV
jgi:hypothetical protein